MTHDPGELKAEFEAECRRVGVRIEDLLPPIDPLALGAAGVLRGVGLDLVAALDCLRHRPDNAGTHAFVRSLKMSQLLQVSGYRPSAPQYSKLRAIAETRL
jgi:hypothetical protein